MVEPDLFPEEHAVITNAVDSRRREFGTARRCARLAMAKLGIPPAPLLPGEGRAPQWPAAVVGSLTHCAGYRAAAVARTHTTHTIGIDAEPNEPLPPGIVDLITLPEERDQLAWLGSVRGGVHWDRLIFSCKEAVYKAWFPLTRRWLGFEGAVVRIDPARSAFTARVLVPGPVVDGTELPGFSGCWLARGGLLLTAIALPSSGLSGQASGLIEHALTGRSDAGLEPAPRVQVSHHRADVAAAGAHGHP
jgi:4'-phosphopantetheinyl transferase EntD